MHRDRINIAKVEAEEFLKWTKRVLATYPKDAKNVGGTKLTAALRRQSMNLTRALAELRKPTWEWEN